MSARERLKRTVKLFDQCKRIQLQGRGPLMKFHQVYTLTTGFDFCDVGLRALEPLPKVHLGPVEFFSSRLQLVQQLDVGGIAIGVQGRFAIRSRLYGFQLQ